MKKIHFYSIIPALPITIVNLSILPLTLDQGNANLHTSLIQISWMTIYAILLICSVSKIVAFANGAKTNLFLKRTIVRTYMYLLFFISSLFLKLINSTFLCVGRNNGDGVDTLEACTEGQIFGILIYSVLVIPAIIYSSRKIITKNS